METKDLNQLVGNKKNPRKISTHDFEALVKSIKELGDLSGVVFNVASGQLVGGHQRVQAFQRIQGAKNVTITQRLEQPDKTGTVAYGYVNLDGVFFGYREVNWPLDMTNPETGEAFSGKEHAANVAANRIQGEFDLDLLAELNYKLLQQDGGQDLLALTGQTEDEINSLLNSIGAGDGEDDDLYTKEVVAPTYEPKGEKPDINQLINPERTNKLLAEIESANITDAEKGFLRLAAMRHSVFDYSKIADYYAHSSPELQNLMENSALIIIDYNKAIELGYVQATKDIMEVQAEDYAE